jgi:protein-S-isoprenylcysteine O-methyltransferase Ste14
MTLGWGLAFGTGMGIVLTALLVPPLIARMDAEEALLSTRFGREYEAYRSRTPRLLPWLW